jgi:hypothetical protein
MALFIFLKTHFGVLKKGGKAKMGCRAILKKGFTFN